jgi:hypothetical protein
VPCAEAVDEETSLWKDEESGVTRDELLEDCDYKISSGVEVEALAGRDYCGGAVFRDDGWAEVVLSRC